MRDDPALLDRGPLQLDMRDEAGALLFRITVNTHETPPQAGGPRPR
jgi:hypothetical protein